MKPRQGQGISRPQKPANEQRFSFYQGRAPRFYLLIFSIRKILLLIFSLLALDENYDDWKNIPDYNYDRNGFFKWAITVPMKVLYHFTIPDCRNPR